MGVNMSDPRNQAVSLQESLAQATRWRLMALLLAPPGPGLADEVERLGGTLGGALRARAAEVARAAREDPDLDAAHHRLLGPGGACPPAESDHDPAASCNKGPLIADVQAFYRAFGFDPTSEWPECPDHVAVECAFYSYLHFKVAQALFADQPEPAEVTRKALADFWTDHLGRFLGGLLERLAEASRGHSTYEKATRLAMELAG